MLGAEEAFLKSYQKAREDAANSSVFPLSIRRLQGGSPEIGRTSFEYGRTPNFGGDRPFGVGSLDTMGDSGPRFSSPKAEVQAVRNQSLVSGLEGELNSAMGKLQGERQRHKAEVDTLRTELDTLLRSHTQLQAHLAMVKEAPQEDYGRWREERSRLEEEIVALKHRTRSLESEKERLAAQVAEYEKAPPQRVDLEMRFDMAALGRERDDWKAKAAVAESAQVRAEKRLKAVEDELRAGQHENDTLRRKLPEVECRAQEHETVRRRLNDELQAIAESLQDNKRHLHSEESKRQLAEKKISSLEDELTEARSLLQKVTKEKDTFETECQNLRHALESERRAKVDEQGALIELKGRSMATEQQFQQRVSHLETTTQEQAATIGKQEHTLQELQLALVKSKEKCQAMQDARQDAERQLQELQLQASKTDAEQKAEIQVLRATAADLRTEKTRAESTLVSQRQANLEVHRLVDGQRREAEDKDRRMGRARNLVQQWERRCAVVSRQLQDERKRNQELTQELTAAMQAAKMLQAGQQDAMVGRMAQKVSDLHQWKGGALDRIHQQQDAIEALQQKYKKQVHTNTLLQDRIRLLAKAEHNDGGGGPRGDGAAASLTPSPPPTAFAPQPRRHRGSAPGRSPTDGFEDTRFDDDEEVFGPRGLSPDIAEPGIRRGGGDGCLCSELSGSSSVDTYTESRPQGPPRFGGPDRDDTADILDAMPPSPMLRAMAAPDIPQGKAAGKAPKRSKSAGSVDKPKQRTQVARVARVVDRPHVGSK
mmetsp:Transcript_78747/g.210237  ORF Transcript_78747/g.210237 Transcript_78747/m.210237 type:complete len:769 (+) Transcript_78747:81-2387(+)